MAGYSISSYALFSLCISSTKSISPSLRFVSMATRSPGFSIAGPEVMRIFTPISFAITAASVVLPSPGGPCSSTWSSGSLRRRAASMKTLRLSLAFSCPIYSFMVLGLRLPSPASSGSTEELVTTGVSSRPSEKLMLICYFLYIRFFSAALTICSVSILLISMPLSEAFISAVP